MSKAITTRGSRVFLIDSAGLMQARVWPMIEEASEELHLSEDAKMEILDWCICEIYRQAFEHNNIRLLRHFKYDEARAVFDNLTDKLLENFTKPLIRRYEPYRGAYAKIMISGTNALVSIET